MVSKVTKISLPDGEELQAFMKPSLHGGDITRQELVDL